MDRTSAHDADARRLRGRRLGETLGGMLLLVAAAACRINDEGALPPNVPDPETLRTPAGAMALYRGAIDSFPIGVNLALFKGGILTDDLTTRPTKFNVYAKYTQLDSRVDLGGGADEVYNALHKTRAQTREARGFLAAYLPDSSPALSGRLYAFEGYADVLLADLFCSGIPLSTVDFDANYTLAPGSSTSEVYRQAVALFDTALTLASDSVGVQNLAAVGRGRALLALGQYAAAAAAVSGVPSDFLYQIVTLGGGGDTNAARLQSAVWLFANGSDARAANAVGVPDREGLTGLPYRSSTDPRVPLIEYSRIAPDGNTLFLYGPALYAGVDPVPLSLASGVEARLIEAEAALQASPDGGQWLTILNQLRQLVALPDTTDPGPGGPGGNGFRVDLLFRERAFWLFLTGHRLGDLRRLVRQYQRSPDSVYPTGGYTGGPGRYGDQLVFPVPESERQSNAKYTGCINANA